MKKQRPSKETIAFTKNVGRALRRAAKQARRIARAYGTPIYVSKNGKVVALKP
jgi:hypothetical protein